MTAHRHAPGAWSPILAVLMVATLLLASCAPAAAPAPPQAPAAQAPAAQQPPAATATPAGPKRGGSIVWVLYNEAGEYDPHTLAQQMYLWELGGNSLLKLDRDTGKPVGDLVERWEQKDNLTFVFYLRKGVKFHNTAPVNGREFNADDVVYSMARLRSPGAKFPRRSYFDSVKSIEKVDDSTVKLTLSEPFGPLLVYLAFPFIKMVPKEVVDKYNGLDRPETTIGTGPFLFKEYTKDVGGSMVRNPNYFRPGLPYLDEVRFQVITDDATRTSAARTGRVDIAQRMPVSAYKSIQQTNPNVLADTEAVPWTAQLIMRHDRKPWSDIRVRKAINLAVDRQEIVSGAHEGAGFITGAIPSGQVAWAALDYEKDLKNLPGYRQPKDQDIAEAKKLMT
ncbi:MAG: ABC transporter substrate-binding protein, partial [Chloroflexota bacterium]